MTHRATLRRPRRDLERLALELLDRCGINDPPVDVEQLARCLGVRIEPADLGEDCSGILVRTEQSAVIGVNLMHHPNRRRFTIAHELGHHVLHRPGTYVDRAFYRNVESGSGTIKEERAANQFAAALLMPASWVKQAAEEYRLDLGDDTSLLALAEQFGVSSQAMSFRLTNLGLV